MNTLKKYSISLTIYLATSANFVYAATFVPTFTINSPLTLNTPGSRTPLADEIGTLIISKNPAFAGDPRASLSIINGVQIDKIGTVNIAGPFGSEGEVSISGDNSLLDVSALIRVGFNGSGWLFLADGANIKSQNVVVASAAAASGTIEVTGSESLFSASDLVTVGRLGIGALNILDGGKFLAQDLDASTGINSKADIHLEGVGSSLIVLDRLSIGLNGAAKITALAGAKIEADTVYFGQMAHNNITDARLSGTGSSLSGREIYLGAKSYSQLFIRDGATVNAGQFIMGNGGDVTLSSGEGVLFVSDEGSLLDVEQSLFVGTFGGAGLVQVANGGRIKAGSILLGNLSPITGNSGLIYIGSFISGIDSTPGHIDAGEILFSDSIGRLIFNHDSSDYLFGTPLRSSAQGNGIVSSLSGTTKIANAENYRGLFNINGGTLIIEQAPNSSVNVSNGGKVAGNSIFASVDIGSQGSLSPGNSIGIITAIGDASFGAGSIYDVEMDKNGNVDFFQIGGTLNISNGSTLQLRPLDTAADNALLSGLDRRLIATANNGISGKFSTVLDSFTYLDPVLLYDAQNIFVSFLLNPAGLNALSKTSNQQATAKAIGELDRESSLYQAIATLPGPEVGNALDMISGSSYNALHNITITASEDIEHIIKGRFQMNDKTPEDGIHYWVSALDKNNSFKKSGFGNSYSKEADILALGIEKSSTKGVIGYTLGFGNTNYKIENDHLTGTIESVYLSSFGRLFLKDFTFSSILTGAHHKIAASRNIKISTLSETLDSKFKVLSAHLYNELSREISISEKSTIEPFVGLSANILNGNFKEAGGITEIKGELDDDLQWNSSIGIRLSQNCNNIQHLPFCLDATLSWKNSHFDSVKTKNTLSGGPSFTVQGEDYAHNSATVDLGITSKLDNHHHYRISASSQIYGKTNYVSPTINISITF